MERRSEGGENLCLGFYVVDRMCRNDTALSSDKLRRLFFARACLVLGGVMDELMKWPDGDKDGEKGERVAANDKGRKVKRI